MGNYLCYVRSHVVIMILTDLKMLVFSCSTVYFELSSEHCAEKIVSFYSGFHQTQKTQKLSLYPVWIQSQLLGFLSLVET